MSIKHEESQMKQDTRYPYTYATNYIRILAGYEVGGTKISRSDASRIIEGISVAMKIDGVELAARLADYFKENEDDLRQKSSQELLRVYENRVV